MSLACLVHPDPESPLVWRGVRLSMSCVCWRGCWRGATRLPHGLLHNQASGFESLPAVSVVTVLTLLACFEIGHQKRECTIRTAKPNPTVPAQGN